MRDHITVDGKRCEVKPVCRKGLGHYEFINSPVAEVFAPEGYEFSGGETSLMAHKAADFDAIEAGEQLSERESE